jgi:hypothetical protein
VARLKLFLAWLASHWDALAALFPLYWSRSFYFFNHRWALGLRFDTGRKVRFVIEAEVAPGSDYYQFTLAVGPFYADFSRVVEF